MPPSNHDEPVKFETIIFDLDGVIICSLPVAREAYYAAHEAIVGGEPPPFTEYQKYFGRSFPEILKIMGLPIEMHKVFKAESNRRMSMIEVYPGIRDMLESIKNAGIKTAIATGKDWERATATLEYLDLLKYFDLVLGSDLVEKPKPAPDMALKAMETLTANPQTTLFCGDAVADVMCGKSANIRVAAAFWGEAMEDDIMALNPNYVLRHPPELIDLIGIKDRA